MPKRASTPDSGSHTAIAASTSPSEMSLILAPAIRSSSMRPTCLSRSRTTHVTSLTGFFSARAMAWTLTVGERVMSTCPTAAGPTTSLSM